MNYIVGKESFLSFYKLLSVEDSKKVWIIVKTSDNKDLYLKDYNEWLTIPRYCALNNLDVLSVSLQYVTNVITVDVDKYEGVYLIRSIKGQFGAKERQCFTIGLIEGGIVHKTMWNTPELIQDLSFSESIEKCFEEAIVFNGTRRKQEAETKLIY
jgi:hypothetical protein